MYKKIFLKAGLSPTQAEILDYLYQKKEDKASEIAKKIKKSRAIVYKDLDELVVLNVVEKEDKPNKVSVFSIAHPYQMEKFFDNKENEIKKDRQLFNNYLPDMISAYNLMSSKPGVLYFEGKEGIKNALKHIMKNFKQDREITSFVKVLTPKYEKEINEAFNEYIKKRIELKVKTRVIALDTEEGRILKENDEKSYRKTLLAKTMKIPLDFQGGELFIYRNEVCAITMENDIHFAFIVQNKAIAQMLRAFFESEWSLLPDL